MTADLFPTDSSLRLLRACQQCGSTGGYLADGKGPHAAELRCVRGHHQRWLPKHSLAASVASGATPQRRHP